MCSLLIRFFFLFLISSCTENTIEDYGSLGGDFSFTDTDSKTFHLEDEKGKPFILIFGFTHCPGFCPAALSRIQSAWEILDKRPEFPTTLFVTVDPDRDSKTTVTSFLQSYSIPRRGLMGSESETKVAIKKYGGYFEKHLGTISSEIGIDHSLFIYLIGKNSRVVRIFKPDDRPDQIARAVQKYLQYV